MVISFNQLSSHPLLVSSNPTSLCLSEFLFVFQPSFFPALPFPSSSLALLHPPPFSHDRVFV